MNKIKRLCFLLVGCGLLSTVTAQTVKPVTVSAEDSFTDNIALLEDSRDMDLMVKFVFNEETNQLTVSLISYRSLFVFRDDTRYKMAVKCRKLRPDRFPYIVEAEPGVKFKLTKDFRRSLPKPKKKYIFKRWVEYDGLQPVPMEYKMVNDFIEQTFDIMGKREDVSVTLRDLMVMEAYSKNQNKPPVYSLFFRKDLNTRYQIHIQRNPCFGQDEDIAAATNACEGIAKAYQTFKSVYASGQVPNNEKLDAFKELKAALLKQYQKISDVSPCQTIQDARDRYNTYVDSIAAVNCVIRNSGEGGGGGAAVRQGNANLDARPLLANARQINSAVSRWLASNDPIERRDLIDRCKALIEGTNAMIGGGSGATEELQRAIAVFRAAERYFKKTCKQ